MNLIAMGVAAKKGGGGDAWCQPSTTRPAQAKTTGDQSAERNYI